MAVPTFSIVDQEDNTGATATVEGSDVGSMNSISVWRTRGVANGLQHVGDFGRVGDGDIDLVTTKGSFLAILTSNSSGTLTISDPAWFHVTTGDDDLFALILDRCVAVLQTLNLAPFTPSEVYASKVPIPDAINPRIGVVVCPAPDVINYVMSDAVDFGFRFQIITIALSNGDYSSNQNNILNQRLAIQKAFIPCAAPAYDPFAGMAGINNCVLEGGLPIELPEAFLKNYDVGIVGIRVMTRNSRSNL